jgi:hypothetical protein
MRSDAEGAGGAGYHDDPLGRERPAKFPEAGGAGSGGGRG